MSQLTQLKALIKWESHMKRQIFEGLGNLNWKVISLNRSTRAVLLFINALVFDLAYNP